MSEEQIPEPTGTEEIEVEAHSVSSGCIVNNSAALTEDEDVAAHTAASLREIDVVAEIAKSGGCIVNNSAALSDEDVAAHVATSGCVINNSAALTDDEG
ncbi:MAG TPA: hypothetical protein VFN97_17200 [Actinospica sp.]|nr:hypothetical protein [Actinospica sp.]